MSLPRTAPSSRMCKSVLMALMAVALNGCITQSASLVSPALQPQPGAPVAYLVGSIGPQNVLVSQASTQTLLIRRRGTADEAQARWRHQGAYRTPADIELGGGTSASVFVLPLTPGDYELYDYRLHSLYTQRGLTIDSTLHAREEFTVPLHLEAGKAYYLGEFRSICTAERRCGFLWRDQLTRDEGPARQRVPQLPRLEEARLDLQDAGVIIIPSASGQVQP